MWSWWRWARRDRRLALIMLVDGLLLALVIGLLLILVWPVPSTILAQTTPAARLTTVLPTVGFAPDSPAPLPPTANPTRLAALPNQGQSAAPPAPPGLLVPPSNFTPTLTPTSTSQP